MGLNMFSCHGVGCVVMVLDVFRVIGVVMVLDVFRVVGVGLKRKPFGCHGVEHV